MSISQQSNGKQNLHLTDPHQAARFSSRVSPHAHGHVGPLIGRERELQQIADRFADANCRLLTLVGLGGIGKTRIALEAARQAASTFTHGAVFVPLGFLGSSELIVPALADALGCAFHGHKPPNEQLLDFLRSRNVMLVLDNFEHLMDGVSLVPELLHAAPGVRVLVTSRERLNLREEWVLDIRGLEYPDDEADPRAHEYSAIRLFIERARRVKADFRLTLDNQADIIRICRLVAGLPLGIELATSWLRTLSCRAIGAEIEQNLDLLSTQVRNWPEKHRSLRAVFVHSWTLLPPDERRALERLAVFRNGFRRDAARMVAGADLAVLGGLVDKALLAVSPEDRFDMHNLVQRYALDLLEAAGEGDRAREAHCAYFAAFLAQCVEDLKGRRQLEALQEINEEFENVRTAWGWAVQHRDLVRLDQMVDGLWLFGDISGRWHECEALFADALTHLTPPTDAGAEQLWGRVAARVSQEKATALQDQLEAALEIARRHGDRAEIAFCLTELGWAAYASRDHATAKQLLEESLALYRQLGDDYYVAQALFDLSIGDYDISWERVNLLGEESLRLRREMGDLVGVAMSLFVTARDAAAMGNYAEAERLWQERIAVGRKIQNQSLVALGFAHLSYQVYFVQGDFAAARAAAEEALQIALALHLADPAAWAYVTLGLLACMDEDYTSGLALCEQGAATGFIAETALYGAWGACVAACGLADYDLLRAKFPDALLYNKKMRRVVGTVMCLPLAAILLARQGQAALAVEWLALAFSHPVRAAGWMEKWPLLSRFQADLTAALGPEAYHAAWERGTRLDIEVVGVELHTRFGPGVQPSPRTPNLLLPEPLTERELEVLRLMAAGYSNPQVAEQLVISVGTVKAHTSSIYGKLGVHNRVQAIAEARSLGLL